MMQKCCKNDENLMHGSDNIFFGNNKYKRKDWKTMTTFYIDGEGNREKRPLLKAGEIILWALMIGVSVFLASRSLIM
ncbi:MAG: hypothetical protein NC400_11000 [Clostridium sp.]|nr:hypothetical protein [Clostridium sp.]